MDPIFLSRLQFAVTTVYHFFFVPLALGLSVLVAIIGTIAVVMVILNGHSQAQHMVATQPS